MLCEPEQVTHTLRTDCVWTGQVADAVDTIPASPKSLLGLPAAEATVDPDCIHHGYRHLPASLLEPFPASWERPQPACGPAPKCQGFNPTGKAPYRRLTEGGEYIHLASSLLVGTTQRCPGWQGVGQWSTNASLLDCFLFPAYSCTSSLVSRDHLSKHCQYPSPIRVYFWDNPD